MTLTLTEYELKLAVAEWLNARPWKLGQAICAADVKVAADTSTWSVLADGRPGWRPTPWNERLGVDIAGAMAGPREIAKKGGAK